MDIEKELKYLLSETRRVYNEITKELKKEKIKNFFYKDIYLILEAYFDLQEFDFNKTILARLFTNSLIDKQLWMCELENAIEEQLEELIKWENQH